MNKITKLLQKFSKDKKTTSGPVRMTDGVGADWKEIFEERYFMPLTLIALLIIFFIIMQNTAVLSRIEKKQQALSAFHRQILEHEERLDRFDQDFDGKQASIAKQIAGLKSAVNDTYLSINAERAETKLSASNYTAIVNSIDELQTSQTFLREKISDINTEINQIKKANIQVEIVPVPVTVPQPEQ